MSEFDIYINADGSVEHIYDDELATLFDGEHVETNDLKRLRYREQITGAR